MQLQRCRATVAVAAAIADVTTAAIAIAAAVVYTFYDFFYHFAELKIKCLGNIEDAKLL